MSAKGLKYMIDKQKIYSIALVSAVAIFMLMSIVGAVPFAYIPNFYSNNISVIDTATNNIIANVTGLNFPIGVAITGAHVYVTNTNNNTVSVIDTTTNNITTNVTGLSYPYGVVVTPDGTNVYVTNWGSNTTSVINTTTNNVIANVTVGNYPVGVAVTPDGTKVYVANEANNNVSVINTSTNSIIANVSVGYEPWGVAITPDGTKVYVANINNVSVINTTSNTVTYTVDVGPRPWYVAVTPDGTKVYGTNTDNNSVFVINTTTNNVTATVPVGNYPQGVAVTPDGTKVYVTNVASNNVSVINTITNNVTASVSVGYEPFAFGRFIGKATPKIIWNNRTDIVYGTPLSDILLGATALDPVSGDTVLGTFSYTLPSDTVLDEGTHRVNIFFTPTDTIDYTTSSVTVSINVKPAEQGAALTIVKSASPTTYTTVGDKIGYTYLITNTGKVPLSKIQLTDVQADPNSIVVPSATLAVGDHETATATHTISQADITAGSVTNIGIVTSNKGATAQDQATVTLNQPPSQQPALTIVKSASPSSYDHVGEPITYTYTVKNTGDVEIKGPITVTDDKFGTITIPNSDILSKGSSVTGASTYKITDADINAGHVTNLAYTTGLFNNQPIISPQSIALIRYKHPTNEKEHNEEEHNGDRNNYGGPGYGGYGGAVVPMTMYGSPMYGSPMYGSEPYGTRDVPHSDSNDHKAKAHLSKHKHKNHSKHQKTKKNHPI